LFLLETDQLVRVIPILMKFMVAIVEVGGDYWREKLLYVEQTGGVAFADACRDAFDSAQKVVDAQPEEQSSLSDLSQMAAGQEVVKYSSELDSIPDLTAMWAKHYNQASLAIEHHFKLLLLTIVGAVGDHLICKTAKPKGLLRSFEKAALRAFEGSQLPWDTCRGCLKGSGPALRAAFEVLKRQRGLRFHQLNDRFKTPTKEGWRDLAIYFTFEDESCSDVICELQFAHSAFMAVREEMKAHDAYDKVRFAAELRKKVHGSEVVGLPNSQRQKDSK